MLPTKINGQTDLELNLRQTQLEEYMNHVLQLLSRHAQFNYHLLTFIEFMPVSVKCSKKHRGDQ